MSLTEIPLSSRTYCPQHLHWFSVSSISDLEVACFCEDGVISNYHWGRANFKTSPTLRRISNSPLQISISACVLEKCRNTLKKR